MPLTARPVRVLEILRPGPHPGSHVAGSLPLHAQADSVRESRDIDLFHDAMAAMQVANTRDLIALDEAGLYVRRSPMWSDTFCRATVTTRDDEDRSIWPATKPWPWPDAAKPGSSSTSSLGEKVLALF